MKYGRLCTAVVFSLMATLISCGEDSVTGPNGRSAPTAPTMLPEAPGLVGTFSGVVQNISHTKSGGLTISITAYDRSTGNLTGTLKLTGFSDCFTTGTFPYPNHINRYYPGQFGTINAAGIQQGSYSFLYFLESDDFTKGLELNGLTEELGFFNGKDWCLEIDPVVLKRK